MSKTLRNTGITRLRVFLVLMTAFCVTSGYTQPAPTENPAPAENRAGTETELQVIRWTGTLDHFPPMAQFSEYFLRDDGEIYGISLGPEASREEQRLFQQYIRRNAVISVSGTLLEDVPAPYGRLIQIDRYEVLQSESIFYKNFSEGAEPEASSRLVETFGERRLEHAPWNAIDGRFDTSWVEAVDGYGTGEWIRLRFHQKVQIQSVFVSIGYDKNDDLFYSNSRLKQVEITSESDKTISLIHTFRDVRGLQEIVLDPPLAADSLTFTILDVFPGRRFRDTCISEIQVWGTYAE